MSGHPALAALIDYWFGDRDDEALEEHFLGCEQCSARLEEIAALGAGIRAAFLRGALHMVLPRGFVERIRLRAFRPLTVEEDADQRAGWCSIENPLDCELDHGKIFFNSYLNLGLRTDRWQVPSALFKAHFAEAEREHLAKRGREKLGRREKEELRAIVSRKLRAKLMPVMKVVDLSWNLEAGVVRFWNQSPRAHEGLRRARPRARAAARRSRAPSDHRAGGTAGR